MLFIGKISNEFDCFKRQFDSSTIDYRIVPVIDITSPSLIINEKRRSNKMCTCVLVTFLNCKTKARARNFYIFLLFIDCSKTIQVFCF